MELQKEMTLDLLDTTDPSLSTTTDIPVVDTKPDSQPDPKPAPETAKAEVAAPDEGKKPAESAPAEQPEDSSADDKPKAKGVQKRIDELVRQREDAERRAEAERQEKLRLLALVEKGGKKEALEEEGDPEPTRPNRGEFADQAAYDEALINYADAKADWSAKRAVKSALEEDRKERERRSIEEGQKAAQAAYVERVTKASEKYPDYKLVAESPDVTVTIPMAQAIISSEHGPDIAYQLGKNPAEAKRIAALPPHLQLMELGLIVAKLTASTPAPAAPAAKPIVSAAPTPIKPLESKAEPGHKTPDEESMDEYAARRAKELAAERRPGVRH